MAPERAGVAEIFRHAGGAFHERREGRIDAGRLKVMADIEACRTAVLGGHMYACDGCGREHPLYNSCRNRHCPTCQGLAANRWSAARTDDILPVPYFHVVFTLPKEIAAIAFGNRRVVFDILFKTVAETLRTIAADPRHGGLRIGGTAVLHTWDQKLRFHPHLHVVDFPENTVTAAVQDAVKRRLIGFDAVKHLLLARVEKRPANLDLSGYPHLPQPFVAVTRSADYASLLAAAARHG